MTLGDNVFKQKVLEIKNDIQKHKDIDLVDLVQNRLNKTFALYVQQLEISYDRILQVNELRVLSQLSKEGINDRYN